MEDMTIPVTILEPMNLHDPVQFAELRRQRILCGWKSSVVDLEGLRAANDAKTQIIFWIVKPSLSHLPAPERWIGHIAGSRKMYDPEEEEKGLPSRIAVNLHTFFILPEHRGGGLGRAAVQELEKRVKIQWPDCRVMTLNTMARRYIEEDEGRVHAKELYERLGLVLPAKGTSNEDWYARMGYVKWKEAPLYEVTEDGYVYSFPESFMWKQI